ncbi:hypothetical protein ACRTEL_19230 [Vibrio diabolicus]|uniref:hypothetical protein n=1 Tax=Vibrio diabolicus TaxID=50719 RepID=UPI003D7CC02E
MASPLSDLDELVIKCRDKQAQNYIKEAVSCYKAGAFRSAIVSTWIAVSFDIIEKLKDLTLQGDKEAEIHLNAFDDARTKGDISRSLKFEREILAICRDKLELISHVEFIDLDRLQEDRNRCAHPSMTHDGELFSPSAELARIHIRSAVEHFLQYPPSQGKAALESLVSLVESSYFPSNIEKALVAFENSPFRRARKSLVSNFAIVVLKKYIDEPVYKKRLSYSVALNAINELYREEFSEVLATKLSNLLRRLEDKELYKSLYVFEQIPESWEFIDVDVQHKVETYIENLPKEHLDFWEFLLVHDKLSVPAQKRLRKANRSELDEPLFFDPPEAFLERVIELYASSGNFDQANTFATTVIRYAGDYSYSQVNRIVLECGKNDQIEYSFEIGNVINALRRNKFVDDEQVNNWLKEANLTKHIREKAVEEVAEEDG